MQNFDFQIKIIFQYDTIYIIEKTKTYYKQLHEDQPSSLKI